MNPPVRAVNHGERLAPVALPRKQPVTQAVGHGLFAPTGLRQPVTDFRDSLGLVQPVQADFTVGGVLDDAVAGPGFLLHIQAVRAGNSLDNVQVELFGEGVIAFVVGGHGHNRAGAVPHQNVIRHENRHQGTIDRVCPKNAGKHAGLFGEVGFRSPFAVALCAGLRPVGRHRFARGSVSAGPLRAGPLRPSVRHLQLRVRAVLGAHQRVFRGNDHESRAE